MELTFLGANCVRLNSRKASIVIDDNLAELGLKTTVKPTDIHLRTSAQIPPHDALFSTDMPGEYEISGVIIQGVATRSLQDEAGQTNSVIYTIKTEDLKIAVIGHIFPDLSEDLLEQIGLVDIAIVPVGGNNYTLDGAGALKVIKQIEPKIIIPTHYADSKIKYPVPQAGLAEALKGLGMEAAETVVKYKPKLTELTDTARLIVLQRS